MVKFMFVSVLLLYTFYIILQINDIIAKRAYHISFRQKYILIIIVRNSRQSKEMALTNDNIIHLTKNLNLKLEKFRSYFEIVHW